MARELTPGEAASLEQRNHKPPTPLPPRGGSGVVQPNHNPVGTVMPPAANQPGTLGEQLAKAAPRHRTSASVELQTLAKIERLLVTLPRERAQANIRWLAEAWGLRVEAEGVKQP